MVAVPVEEAQVEFEVVEPRYRRVEDFDVETFELLESGEAEVRVPIISGSLPNAPGAKVTLTREDSETSASGFELKVYGIGAKRSAKITITKTTKLVLNPGETKTRFVVVPVAWQRFSSPNQPDNTRLVVTLGEPPDNRYDIVLDETRLPTVLAPTNSVDNETDGDPLTDTETYKTERGVEFSLDLEAENVSATAAISVGFERSTTTTVEYSLPTGRYVLAWLEGPSGVYITTTS